MTDNANTENNVHSEEIQEFVNGIISESTHYGWLNYGSDVSALKDHPILKRLAEEAHKHAKELEDLNNLFMDQMEELGYETEY